MTTAALWREPLAYTRDAAVLFERLVGRRGAVFLNGGMAYGHYGRLGRYDVLAADPARVISSRGGVTSVETRDGARERHTGDPLDVVRAHLWNERVEGGGDCPFQTGAIGYFGYDLGWRFERPPEIAADREQPAEMLLGIYDWAVVVDHKRRETVLIGRPCEGLGEREFAGVLRTLREQPPPRPAAAVCRVTRAPVSNMEQRGYFERFRRIKDYIRAGDCYQVNLAQKFTVGIECDPWHIYRRLHGINPAPFSAYLDFGGLQVISISPERFLRLDANRVETRPVKGTRPRHDDPAADARAIEALRASAKDRAENLMIVDLLRNDIGKTCVPGSVQVSKLFAVESFANVHHMVSTIEGDLAPGMDALHLLKGCFPGGSITGAPKLRAMEIIEELEPDRRGVYCGSIGYLSRHGDADLSIAIRTALHRRGEITFFGGGGIVADSEAEVEYQETLDKVSSMMRLFESL